MANPKRPLPGLLVAQFFGAFNDNAFKMMVTLLAIRAAWQGIDGELAREQASQSVTTLAFVVFTLPLMVFSLPAMALGDRISKRTLILATKLLELVLMACGTVALAAAHGGLPGLIVLGLMGVQSAFFAPAKYGILPEIVPHEKLAASNGLLEMWSFLAIILGTVAGGLLLEAAGAQVWIAGAALTGFAAIGLGFAFQVPAVAAAGGRESLAGVVRGSWRAARADRVLWLAIVGSAYYWGIASLLGQDLLIYGKNVVGLGDDAAGAPLAVLAIGVGIGALLAGRISRHKVEYGLIPLGALGITLATFVFWCLRPGLGGMFVLMACIGVASGFVVVPLNALIQWRAPRDRRGAIIAFANFVAFAGILLGSLACNWMAQLAWSSHTIVLGTSIATLLATAWAIWLMPESFLRLALVLATSTIYRLRIVGRQHVPAEGGALLVPNHVSFVDGLFLMASTDRSIRFVVEQEYYDWPLLRPVLKAMGAIPIAASGGPRVVLRALRDAGAYLDRGELVCIFAEGEISRHGLMLPFRRGLQRIVKGRSAGIVPVHLDRVWGSIFAPAGGKWFRRLPARLPVPITVSFGAPLPPTTDPATVRQQVLELGEAATALRESDYRPLHRSFVGLARRRPWTLAFTDASGQRVRYGKALVGALALARALRAAWRDQPHVGILLPPSIGGALVNLAASLAGRASVNLNYTAGAAGLTSAARQAGLRTVVTSREFLDKAHVALPEGITPIWIEAVRDRIGAARRLGALLAAWTLPKGLLERFAGAARGVRRDDVATVIFSSGSTGEPKGVVLTHRNIDSNSESVAQVLQISHRDRLLGILPLFHSFGYMALWFAANHRIATVFHPNPLDAAAIGSLVQRHRVTILVATPTFLQLYMRRCTPGQLGSLRIVMAGAEKLPPQLAVAFEERFAVRVLEGYGTTECAPVVAVSTLGYRAPGFYQVGHKRGSVGTPLPGVAVRIVDPESFAPLPAGDAGMLLVRGPNVMRGYLGRDDLTAQALRDGWYVTGDIARLDDDGFLFITDRLSRFSKIAGEMVPHGRVEQALHEAGGCAVPTFAVTAVPDERKGERLIVLHTLDEARLPDVLAKLGGAGLPKLFLPKLDQFVRVEALPLLGTGKLDLRAIKEMALAHARA
jgi:acyl-[acyl-carrier-protein]-phospholipid O-acyltransferase/long-chain-fatty-acid--[acyl-carrier-protein] ligase